MTQYVQIDASTWKKIEYYYRIRCKLIHEKATVALDDSELSDFRGVVEKVLKQLYKLKFTRE